MVFLFEVTKKETTKNKNELMVCKCVAAIYIDSILFDKNIYVLLYHFTRQINKIVKHFFKLTPLNL